MLPSTARGQAGDARHAAHRSHWEDLTDLWNRTPGYLKWLGGILLGALVRILGERLFPEGWERFTHRVLDPSMPIWLAVVILVAVLALERLAPRLYRRVRAAQATEVPLRTHFGVRWAVPPDVETVQGPYCVSCPARLRGVLWSGDASPTLWACPSCGQEFSTPEFPDIAREVERQLTPG
jgi:hypothetical protein